MLDRSKSYLLLAVLGIILVMCMIIFCGGGWVFQRLLLQQIPLGARGNGVTHNSGGVEHGSGYFSMTTAETNRPSSILEQVQYFLGGGGESCTPEDTDRSSLGPATVEIKPTTTGWEAGVINFWSCGWNSVGTLPITVDYPDGTSTSVSADVVEAGGGLALFFKLQLRPNPPLGTYVITVRGQGETTTHVFDLRRPTEPKLYYLPDNVVLWNFRPNERITLVAYKKDSSTRTLTMTFMAYKEFMTDENGELYINVDGEFDAFAAIGEYTGEVKGGRYYISGTVYTP